MQKKIMAMPAARAFRDNSYVVPAAIAIAT